MPTVRNKCVLFLTSRKIFVEWDSYYPHTALHDADHKEIRSSTACRPLGFCRWHEATVQDFSDAAD